VSGRVWIAETGKPAQLQKAFWKDDEFYYYDVDPCHINAPDIQEHGSTVFLDLYPGFKKKGRTILTDSEASQLFGSLFGKPYGVTMLGSNGQHFALVANGAQGIAGGITTAIGGPWDIAPALLVFQAGGSIRGFSINDMGILKSENALDPMACDIVIYGSSSNHVEKLVSALMDLHIPQNRILDKG
jgi:fructose-1,6-bisphosphatase/inositol monophosphatase family enzyme